jgi:DNA (cytosine-5)-methyltransferase 1|nr:MAG TPA: Cytosine specific methyltransferase [Bacteriophage sp.]
MEILGSIYTGVSDDFQRGVYPIARCVKAENHDLGVIMADVNVIGSLEAKFESTNRIYDVGRCSPTLSTMQGGGREPKILESQIVAMRGRNPDNPSDRTAGSPTEQRLEVNTQGTSNCLTSVQKDNLVMEEAILQRARGFNAGGEHKICPPITANSFQNNNLLKCKYRIRKLTPRECGRLMGVSDEDISKMAAVNSNTQLYKQFGNSIVVDVMCAMFENLNISQ